MIALNSTGGSGNAYIHTGITITPDVTVSDDTVLSLSTDYTLGGDIEGTEAGTYTLTVTGKGNYKDTISVTWKIIDTNPPTGKIEVADNTWNQFLNSITYGNFFKETQTVTITGEDSVGESGLDKVYYLTSENELTIEEIRDKTDSDWTELSLDATGSGSFNIDPDQKIVIYAKITDISGNETFISSQGIVLDATAPIISGMTDGKEYCSLQTIQVSDDNLQEVTIDNSPITLVDGTYQLEEKSDAQVIKAVDKAGNETIVSVIIHANHSWGEWVIDKNDTATTEGKKHKECSVCHQKKYETIPKTGTPDDSGLGADAGDISKESVVQPGAPDATINTSKADLVTASGIFTPDELADISAGTADAIVWLEIIPLSTPQGVGAQTKFEDKAEELVGQDSNITYFDISLWKKLSTSVDATSVHEPGTDISVTIVIPEALRNTDSSKDRTYYILRVHDGGECEVLAQGIPSSDWTFTFVTNVFSDYAITYKDTPKSIPSDVGTGDDSGTGSTSGTGDDSSTGSTSGTGNSSGTGSNSTDNMNVDNTTQIPANAQNAGNKSPRTGDVANLTGWLFLLMTGIVGITGFSVYRRKKKISENG